VPISSSSRRASRAAACIGRVLTSIRWSHSAPSPVPIVGTRRGRGSAHAFAQRLSSDAARVGDYAIPPLPTSRFATHPRRRTPDHARSLRVPIHRPGAANQSSTAALRSSTHGSAMATSRFNGSVAFASQANPAANPAAHPG